MSDNNSSSGGVGLIGMTFLVFLILKLTKVINWSWWWITAPLWISVALIIILVLLVAWANKH